MIYRLNDHGKKLAMEFINELKAKRKEILDAGLDTVDETELPTLQDIEDDVNFNGLDSECEYYNGWAVTDHYDSDYPLLLKLERDFDGHEGEIE